MLLGDQGVSPLLFWLPMFLTGIILAYVVAARMWKRRHSIFWVVQRITGAYLAVLIPAYFIYRQLIPLVENAGFQGFFVQGIFATMLLAVLYHGGYGVWSVASDYLSSRGHRTGLAFLITVVMLIFFITGMRRIFVV
jgi:succinate dehydrogenase hydrophobic membrane anchor protein